VNAPLETEPFRILIVDDHPLFREGIRQYLDRQADLQVCGECATSEEALQLAAERKPDVVTVDISLGNGNGIHLVKALRTAHPDLMVLVVSMHDESLYAERSMRAGAMGYVMKHDPPRTVVDAIREVLGGGMHFSQERVSSWSLRVEQGEDAAEVTAPTGLLSERETEVFRWIGSGLPTREIAAVMELTIPTINSFRARIKDKLQLRNGAELALRAMQWVQEENRGK